MFYNIYKHKYIICHTIPYHSDQPLTTIPDNNPNPKDPGPNLGGSKGNPNENPNANSNPNSNPNPNPNPNANDPLATPSPTQPNITYIIPPLYITEKTEILKYYFDKSVIFMGMINNAESTLPHILGQLNELTCLFRNTYFLFFESNSIDNTTKILNNWYNNATLNSNNYEFISFCDNIIDRNLFPTHRANKVYKYIIYGDDIVRRELNLEIRKRSNSTYIHKLSRVEKFVPYRNMMLDQLINITTNINNDIIFDYVFMIDIDVFEIDFVTFLSELIVCDTDIMCINGVDQYNDYRDSFATVEMSHNWIHRPFIFNKTDSYYDKARNILRKKMPRKNQRFEQVRSCFNGLASYKIKINELIKSKCKYYSNDDILLLKSKLMKKSTQNTQNEDYDVNNNDNDNDNDETQWISDIAKLINWSNLKGVMFDNDSGYETNLCEHIAFHYCLSNIADITLSIAKNTKLYYYPLAPPQTKEDRRARRRRRRRQARRQQRKEMFIHH